MTKTFHPRDPWRVDRAIGGLWSSLRVLARPAMLALGAPLVAASAQAQSPSLAPVIGANWTGSTYKFDAGVPPPDTMGAVGPRHFVEFINSRYAVYDKATGALVQQSTLDQFWQASWARSGGELANPNLACFPVSAAFDPRILFDRTEGRWYAIAEDSVGLLVAVSNGADPARGWTGYQIDTSSMTRRFTVPANVAGQLDARNKQAVQQAIAVASNNSVLFDHPDDDLLIRVIQPGKRWLLIKARYGGLNHCGGEAHGRWVVKNEGNELNVYEYNPFDFPTLGMDRDNLYVATSQGANPFFVISKHALRTGTAPTVASTIIPNGPTSWQTQPVLDLDGHRSNVALAVEAASFNSLKLHHVSPRGGIVLVGSVQLTGYRPPPAGRQPGRDRNTAKNSGYVQPTGDPDVDDHGLATNDVNRLSSNVVLKNGELHGVQTVGVTIKGKLHARVRYFRVGVQHTSSRNHFEFVVRDDQVLAAPAAPSEAPEMDMYYPSVAVNEHRQVVVGFSASSSERFAASYVVVGHVAPYTQHIRFGEPIVLKTGHDEYQVGLTQGQISASGRNAWGDYSATMVDPFDPWRFWTIQEWASALDIWSTQISAIRLFARPGPGTPHGIRAPSVSAVATGSSRPVIRNFGELDLGRLDQGAAVINHRFVISPTASTGRQRVTLGDGVDEKTTWSFNFAEDPRYLSFFHPTAQPLRSARLDLSLVPKPGCHGDALRIGTLADIKLTDITLEGCLDQHLSATVDLLRFYSAQDLLDALAATPFSVRMVYGSNAIVTSARLTLTAQRRQGDLNGDHRVDGTDLRLLMREEVDRPAQASLCGPLCDLDGDGRITVLDTQRLLLLCDRPACEP